MKDKIRVTLSKQEKLLYYGYISKIDSANSLIEVETYYHLAKDIIEKSILFHKNS
ncbi:hypothetical protein ACFFIX_14200 [Metabacillus herbersteinensis]|uniref:Uncharacterized protein n=1 Tax=Metabacillus herbersteinensis TaxID=283816 RepID=A0ABV6GFW5_9BACI